MQDIARIVRQVAPKALEQRPGQVLRPAAARVGELQVLVLVVGISLVHGDGSAQHAVPAAGDPAQLGYPLAEGVHQGIQLCPDQSSPCGAHMPAGTSASRNPLCPTLVLLSSPLKMGGMRLTT